MAALTEEQIQRIRDAWSAFHEHQTEAEVAWHTVLIETAVGPTALARALGLSTSGAFRHIHLARERQAASLA